MRQDTIAIEQALAVDARPLELAVVIPTFNEAANVEPMLARLAVALAGISWEAVFVDDDSPDGTSDLVRRIALTNRSVRIVQRVGRRGLSSAAIEGMLASAAPVVAVIDGDMQHDETILRDLFEAVNSGRADLAVGTRYSYGGSVGDWDRSRHAASRFATRVGQWVLKTELSDPMSGFFAISRDALMRAVPHVSGVGFKLLLDLVASSPEPLRIAETPYSFRPRVSGESKLGSLVALEYLTLLADKTVGRFLPLRLLSFLLVGGLGVGVHLAILGLSVALLVPFVTAEFLAVGGAMTFNFFLNNVFTYRDRRLKGWSMVRGLVSFYLVCSIGGAANIGIGTWVNAQDGRWWIAGFAGVIVGAAWNYAASSFFTWRK